VPSDGSRLRIAYSTIAGVLLGTLSPPALMAMMWYSSCWLRGWAVKAISLSSAMLI